MEAYLKIKPDKIKVKNITKKGIKNICNKFEMCSNKCPLYCEGKGYFYCEAKEGIKKQKEFIKKAKEKIKELELMLEYEVEL